MDSLHLIRSYNTLNFIKNLKEKANNIENAKINRDCLAYIEKNGHNEDILDGKCSKDLFFQVKFNCLIFLI